MPGSICDSAISYTFDNEASLRKIDRLAFSVYQKRLKIHCDKLCPAKPLATRTANDSFSLLQNQRNTSLCSIRLLVLCYDQMNGSIDLLFGGHCGPSLVAFAFKQLYFV